MVRPHNRKHGAGTSKGFSTFSSVITEQRPTAGSRMACWGLTALTSSTSELCILQCFSCTQQPLPAPPMCPVDPLPSRHHLSTPAPRISGWGGIAGVPSSGNSPAARGWPRTWGLAGCPCISAGRRLAAQGAGSRWSNRQGWARSDPPSGSRSDGAASQGKTQCREGMEGSAANRLWSQAPMGAAGVWASPLAPAQGPRPGCGTRSASSTRHHAGTGTEP